MRNIFSYLPSLASTSFRSTWGKRATVQEKIIKQAVKSLSLYILATLKETTNQMSIYPLSIAGLEPDLLVRARLARPYIVTWWLYRSLHVTIHLSTHSYNSHIFALISHSRFLDLYAWAGCKFTTPSSYSSPIHLSIQRMPPSKSRYSGIVSAGVNQRGGERKVEREENWRFIIRKLKPT